MLSVCVLFLIYRKSTSIKETSVIFFLFKEKQLRCETILVVCLLLQRVMTTSRIY